MSDIIQQSPRSDLQYKKISSLENINDINEQVNNSYLLLTNPNVSNFTVKLQTLIDSINSINNEEINNKLTQFYNQVNSLLSNYYTKYDIDNIELNNQYKYQTLLNLIDNLQSELNLYKSEVTVNYYNKDEIDELLRRLKTYLINNINDLKLEINYIKNNITIDNIDSIIWSGYSIVNQQPQYIINTSPINFQFNKGTVTVKYKDDTEDQDITNDAQFIVSTGIIDNNTIILNSSSNNGQHYITVTYQGHECSEKLIFNVQKTTYNNYLWIVDSNNLNKIINNNEFIPNNYIINNSVNCPFESNINYNVKQIIQEKFYNNQETDLLDQSLYIIIPSIFINLQNNILKINNKSLKSNIFEINIIGIEKTFIINQISNIGNYYKNIEYSIIKISDSINNGIKLNI